MMSYMQTKDVMAALRISRTTLRRWVDAKTFPTPGRIGPRRLAWKTSAVEAWQAKQLKGAK